MCVSGLINSALSGRLSTLLSLSLFLASERRWEEMTATRSSATLPVESP